MTTPFEGFRFSVNPTGAVERNPSIAGLKDGRVAIAYENGAGIDVVLRAVGGGLAPPPVHLANAGTNPSVAGLADGRFVIVWQRFSGSNEVAGRIYNDDGTLSAGTFIVANSAVSAEARPDVAATDDGGFYVSWTSSLGSGDVRGRLFNEDGTPANGGDAIVSTPDIEGPVAVALRPDSDGGFNDRLIVYTRDVSFDHGGILGVLVTDNGVSQPFEIDTQVVGIQMDPDVATLATGGYIVAWTDVEGGGNIRANFVSRTGQEGANDFLVNASVSGFQFAPRVAALPDGRFVIVWLDEGSSAIEGQLFDADGARNGSEFVVAENVDVGLFDEYAITPTADGQFTVSWVDPSGAPDLTVRAVTFDPRQGPFNFNGTVAHDHVMGTIFADVLRGYAGNDSMEGGNGDDQLFGQDGNDTLYGRAGNDIADGGAGNDVIFDEAGDDQITGGPGNDTLVGGTGADREDGGSGNDFLTGGSGHDTLIGGSGSDTYYNPGADEIVELAEGGLDTVQSDASFSLAPHAQLENLELGIGNLTGNGNAKANWIRGGNGANTLTGAEGNDTLEGGDGNDRLVGGGGADNLRGGTGNDTYVNPQLAGGTLDTIQEDPGGGNDLIESNMTVVLTALPQIERILLTGSAKIHGIGNAANNVITGNSGVNELRGDMGADTLNGGGGADVMHGGKGNDIMNGGAGGDTLLLETTDTGNDTINGFETAIDRFDLSGGAFSNRAEAGGDTTLTHAGGTIVVTGVTGLTLEQWNGLIEPLSAGGVASGFDAVPATLYVPPAWMIQLWNSDFMAA